MSTWWKVNSYSEVIVPVEVIKETEGFVTIVADPRWPDSKPRRTSKRSCYDNYFRTWKEAHTWLVDSTVKTIAGLDAQLKTENARWLRLRNMQEPTP